MPHEGRQPRDHRTPHHEEQALTTALPRSLRAGLANPFFSQHRHPSEEGYERLYDRGHTLPENEIMPEDDQSVINGKEHDLSHRPSNRSQNNEMVPRSHRQDGVRRANKSLFEDMANKAMPPEESEYMVKRLEKRADGRVQRTYFEGVPLKEVQESAIVLKVGLTFLPGADLPQVNRTEQTNMAGEEPDQKDATWRVNTAGALLMRTSLSKLLFLYECPLPVCKTYLGSRSHSF